MKKNLLLCVVFFTVILSQSNQPYPPINLVTIPTAGTLPKGYFSFDNAFMNQGSILPKFSIGITDNFTLGMSFGISNFIGNGDMRKNKSYPEVQVKYRVYDETETVPALIINVEGNFNSIQDNLRIQIDILFLLTI